MKKRQIFTKAKAIRVSAIILVVLHFCCPILLSAPTTAEQARNAVAGWLRADPQPLEAALGQEITNVETFTDEDGEPIHYVVYLQPCGFVIVSADDLIEPIIAFADDGIFDPSLDNPLGALVNRDLNGRLAMVRQGLVDKSALVDEIDLLAQDKWRELITLADATKVGDDEKSMSSISDVRVDYLIQSNWGQESVCGDYCYNYYTYSPYTYITYPCGCVATAMAQLMRFHEHPTSGIGIHYFTVTYYGVESTEPTIGGDGLGGPYNWNLMDLTPDCSTTEAQREAIGALCYDAAISVYTNFELGGSSAYGVYAIYSMWATFGYNNIIGGANNGYNIGAGLNGMVNPNLDAGYPVLLSISGSSGPAHGVVCDGYGYSSSTLYHHLNMGWDGVDDAWYALPIIDAYYYYNCVDGCAYNIYTSGLGEQ
jgi:hypothetical protein